MQRRSARRFQDPAVRLRGEGVSSIGRADAVICDEEFGTEGPGVPIPEPATLLLSGAARAG